jgi:hypothetical protein
MAATGAIRAHEVRAKEHSAPMGPGGKRRVEQRVSFGDLERNPPAAAFVHRNIGSTGFAQVESHT